MLLWKSNDQAILILKKHLRLKTNDLSARTGGFQRVFYPLQSDFQDTKSNS